jgi:hypothetical protein
MQITATIQIPMSFQNAYYSTSSSFMNALHKKGMLSVGTPGLVQKNYIVAHLPECERQNDAEKTQQHI